MEKPPTISTISECQYLHGYGSEKVAANLQMLNQGNAQPWINKPLVD